MPNAVILGACALFVTIGGGLIGWGLTVKDKLAELETDLARVEQRLDDQATIMKNIREFHIEEYKRLRENKERSE